MKILHITDSHGTVKSPEGRTDIYYLSFLKKMYELKYVIQKNDIKLIIHTGDLFHSPRVSDKFTGQLAEIIKSYNIPMYVVPGNHDIDGYTINTLDQTKLGLLYKTGVVKELDRGHPIQLKVSKENMCISIAGQEYYKDIDSGNMSDFEMHTNNQNANFNILAIHGYLCDKPQHPSIKHTLCQNIVTDADVILAGHFHESFEYHCNDFSVYNPGSFMRVEQTTYNKNHKPQYGILEITNNNGQIMHSYTMHELKIAEPSEKVFDYTIKNQKKKSLITLENFKNSIANTNFNTNLNVSIENIISDVAKNMSVTKEITDKTIDIYHDALNNSPDKLEVQQGFIQDTERKFISSVEIYNFQSHEKTSVTFKDGLNAIIGESNSGKTSILRAIRWCLDNDPLGSDFITTGQNECKVTITFNDNTVITRKRTRNEAGTYEVTGKTVQPDGSVVYWNNTYKGFANNIPVEVSNIHQMPKVNLTKDICTHLNMMSQLDGPFLVTDSPQVKAAVIGRLTGTQIIDLGIKETNKTVLNNSKTIKTYLKEKEEKENELSRYQDLVFYDQYIKYYEIIFNYYNNGFQLALNACDTINSIDEKGSIINTLKSSIQNIQYEIDCRRYIKSISNYLVNESRVIKIYNQILELHAEINALKKKIQWLRVILSFKSFVQEYESKLKIHFNVIDTYSKINDLLDEISNSQSIINSLKNNINILNNIKCYSLKIADYLNSLISQYLIPLRLLCDNIGTVQRDIQRYSEFNTENNDKISFICEQIGQHNTTLDKLFKDNNVCPCCGQKISDEHIPIMKEFMKGRLHG